MKRKNCSNEHCTLPIWSKGMCKFHHARKIASEAAPKLQEYSMLRVKLLKEYPICQVKDCNNLSSDIHHKKGRGKYLLEHLLPVCRACHTQIESHPQWAYDNGYSLKRHTISE